jgi:hypothetical protein
MNAAEPRAGSDRRPKNLQLGRDVSIPEINAQGILRRLLNDFNGLPISSSRTLTPSAEP